MSEEILHNEQVLNTSCCGVTCDYVERFLNSVKFCKKNHRSDGKGGTPPPPPPRPPNLLIGCCHGFPLGLVSMGLQRKEKTPLDWTFQTRTVVLSESRG